MMTSRRLLMRSGWAEESDNLTNAVRYVFGVHVPIAGPRPARDLQLVILDAAAHFSLN
jgi:hypothetical protein